PPGARTRRPCRRCGRCPIDVSRTRSRTSRRCPRSPRATPRAASTAEHALRRSRISTTSRRRKRMRTDEFVKTVTQLGGPSDADRATEVTRTILENLGKRLKGGERSEEHTSALQSRFDVVCRLLLETKNNH